MCFVTASHYSGLTFLCQLRHKELYIPALLCWLSAAEGDFSTHGDQKKIRSKDLTESTLFHFFANQSSRYQKLNFQLLSRSRITWGRVCEGTRLIHDRMLGCLFVLRWPDHLSVSASLNTASGGRPSSIRMGWWTMCGAKGLSEVGLVMPPDLCVADTVAASCFLTAHYSSISQHDFVFHWQHPVTSLYVLYCKFETFPNSTER